MDGRLETVRAGQIGLRPSDGTTTLGRLPLVPNIRTEHSFGGLRTQRGEKGTEEVDGEGREGKRVKLIR